MVTNQPDYERKQNTKKNIIEINNFIKKKLNLDDVYVCYSDNNSHKDRKPNSGMKFKAKKNIKLI